MESEPCVVCGGTGTRTCEACAGKGRIGGFLGIGASFCDECAGEGKVLCRDCVATPLEAETDDGETITALRVALHSNDDSQRTDALAALQESGSSAAIELLVQSLGDGDYAVRAGAERALLGIGGPAIEEIELSHEAAQPAVRSACARLLGELGHSASVEMLLEMARDDTHQEARQAASDALVQLGEAAIGLAKASLARGSYSQKRRVAELLGRIGDEGAVGPLTDALLDWDGDHPVSSILRSLREIDTRWLDRPVASRVVESIPTWLKSADAEQRAVAVDLVEVGRRHEHLGRLIELLVDPDGVVRSRCARSLAKLDPNWARSEPAQEAEPMLVAALDSEDSIIRASAVDALAQISRENSPAWLQRMEQDESKGVRRAAEAASRKLDPALAKQRARREELEKRVAERAVLKECRAQFSLVPTDLAESFQQALTFEAESVGDCIRAYEFRHRDRPAMRGMPVYNAEEQFLGDVLKTLTAIQAILHGASDAISSGKGVDGRPIRPAELARGLRELADDHGPGIHQWRELMDDASRTSVADALITARQISRKLDEAVQGPEPGDTP